MYRPYIFFSVYYYWTPRYFLTMTVKDGTERIGQRKDTVNVPSKVDDNVRAIEAMLT